MKKQLWLVILTLGAITFAHCTSAPPRPEDVKAAMAYSYPGNMVITPNPRFQDALIGIVPIEKRKLRRVKHDLGLAKNFTTLSYLRSSDELKF